MARWLGILGSLLLPIAALATDGNATDANATGAAASGEPGGLIGTLFTLVLLPAIYALLASDHQSVEPDTGSVGAEDPTQPIPA